MIPLIGLIQHNLVPMKTQDTEAFSASHYYRSGLVDGLDYHMSAYIDLDSDESITPLENLTMNKMLPLLPLVGMV